MTHVNKLCGKYSEFQNVTAGLVWFSLFVHPVSHHVTLDMSITDYNLYITTQLIIYGHQPNII